MGATEEGDEDTEGAEGAATAATWEWRSITEPTGPWHRFDDIDTCQMLSLNVAKKYDRPFPIMIGGKVPKLIIT